MRKPVFGNEVFDQWLSTKSQEILLKVDKEKITTEEMIILTLKAQTNHFSHMDDEFRGEFTTIRWQFEQVDKQFEQVDKRFERHETIMMWGFGMLFTGILGLYFK